LEHFGDFNLGLGKRVPRPNLTAFFLETENWGLSGRKGALKDEKVRNRSVRGTLCPEV